MYFFLTVGTRQIAFTGYSKLLAVGTTTLLRRL